MRDVIAVEYMKDNIKFTLVHNENSEHKRIEYEAKNIIEAEQIVTRIKYFIVFFSMLE